MCGIWLWIHPSIYPTQTHETLWESGVNTLDARGPEGARWVDISGQSTWCFTRLAINGLTEGGMQPFNWNDQFVWMCNGEIYNHAQLEEEIPYMRASGSDCEVIGAAYEHTNSAPQSYYASGGATLLNEHTTYDPVTFARSLDGVFALCIYDKSKNCYIVARDPYGVRPLFYMMSKDGWRFASERKALEPFASEGDVIKEFPPGQVWSIKITDFMLYADKFIYHTVPWLKTMSVSDDGVALRASLEAAVTKRVQNTERQVAALLSGGIDSSLIASLVQKNLQQLGKPQLKTFSIGMEGGTDLKYARMVADWIHSDHTEVVVTADEMFNAIPEVVRAIESYDITSVRASVGNYLVAKAVREQSDCKVLFNGDGSDEVFGSYLYFYRAPNDTEFERETRRLLEEIHQYDVLRSDRSISSNGLEARTPFLDKQFVGVAMGYPTESRRPVSGAGGGTGGKPEKWLLRTAFDDGVTLPKEVLWRRKEAFSDGVSAQEKSWFEIIQEKIEERGLVPEEWETIAKAKGWTPVPPTKEAFYYRSLFEESYKHTGSFWPYWMPRWSSTNDPSARTLTVYTPN
jgi:asparagine synthase (glutamine-hydrolysing)